MKVTIMGILMLTLFMACSKQDGIRPQEVFTINSSFSNQAYEIKVLLPKDYDATQSYPTVYLLDGYYHFNDVVNSIQQNSQLQELILVGIFYKDAPFSLDNTGQIELLREVDLTYPTHTPNTGTAIGGGALLFYEFIEKELLPKIEQDYGTDPSKRTIMGHSLGGYFTLFQMFQFHQAPLFNQVVALSPSLWWAELHLLELEEQLATQGVSLPFQLYLGVASQEGIEANILVNQLETQLESHQHPQLNYQLTRYTGGHLHTARKGFDLALKHFFQ